MANDPKKDAPSKPIPRPPEPTPGRRDGTYSEPQPQKPVKPPPK